MSDLPLRLSAALGDAGFTYDAVAGLLGTRAHEALGRNETTPALRRTTEPSPLAILTRLFLLQAAVPADRADRALPGLVACEPPAARYARCSMFAPTPARPTTSGSSAT